MLETKYNIYKINRAIFLFGIFVEKEAYPRYKLR